MEALVKDISYSVRGLIKRPGFTGLIVLVLALAIAASSSIFSIANAVMLKPLSFKDPNQLVWIWATRKNVSRAFFSIPNFSDTNKQNHTLAEVAPLAIWGVNLTGQGEAERLQGVRISANALQMLGVEAAAGRTLLPDDDQPSNPRVAMLSYGLWQRRFATGLTDLPTPTIYGPIPQAPKSAVPFLANNLSLVVRTGIDSEPLAATVRNELRNVDVDVATSGVKPMGQFLAASVAARKFNLELLVTFAATALLLAAAGLYAVIAYLVAQRTREIGIRLALGAAPRDVLRLMVGHGMKLTLLGVAIGFIGAMAVTRLMVSLLFAVTPTDAVTFIIAAAGLILVALVACYIPARRATKVDPLVALRYE